jgi:GntR family transcriptional repressor for pyruvate dehydrogenase complex
MGLESWSAYLAAQRADARDIAELRRLYYVMEQQAARGGWDPEVDAEFHYAITAASHNSLQMHVLDSIHSLFHTTIQVALKEFYQQEGHVQLLLTQHREIMEAIIERKPEKARQQMMNHLALIEEKMAQLLSEKGSGV